MGMQLFLLLLKLGYVVFAFAVHGSSVPFASSRKPPSIHSLKPGAPPSLLPDHAVSPMSTLPPSISRNRDGIEVAPSKEISSPLFPVNHSTAKGPFPAAALAPYKTWRSSNNSPSPLVSSPNPLASLASPPSILFHNRHHARNYSSPYAIQGPSIPPLQSPFSSSMGLGNPVLSPSSLVPSGRSKKSILYPRISPSMSPRKSKVPLTSPLLPPPPPNEDCTSVTCTEPLTNTLPGSPCGCVWPMQVGLRLSVALYTFFPLVSELAKEIAAGLTVKQRQVRIMGANAASQQPEKTIVLIDLVPLGENFDSTLAFLTYKKIWQKKAIINTSLFGDYEVLYVQYPGLPPSPPLASMTTIDDGPYSGLDNNAQTMKPLGVDLRRRQKDGLGGSMIVVIALSSSVALILFIIAVSVLLLKRGDRNLLLAPTPQALAPSVAKPSGAAEYMMFGSGHGSASWSFGSSIATYTGSAKTFSAIEIEKATNNFDPSRIIGEGGFGLVYGGILDDGTKIAIKVLKRDDRQGSREFFAEVEMLSRLHHRNLVKLIGICTEDHSRCLVYELIPNGSVESHLHGVDKESSPLDWSCRLKIALGAARGLAYLHEDSNPCVIHRDFKSSNILLEHDFTPKVSDFGLARSALDEGNKHISTRVMGTFGYVAPEYAMTGHLLVKSDVYSYGVVLLELLTGRKPVDMSQPPGQENLVAWARPLLTSKEGLEMVIDSDLGSDFPFDSVAKVAAIASMCVQPEVSHRPFMGEVVQALKLVCNECDEAKETWSGSYSQEEVSIDIDTRMSTSSAQLPEPSHTRFPVYGYDSSLNPETLISVSDVFSTQARFEMQASGSFRRHSSSGPLRTGRSRQLWQRVRDLSRGSLSEHGFALRLWPRSR